MQAPRAALVVLCAAFGVLASAASVIAHHSFQAEFDIKQPLVLRGTVVEMEWINPHSWLQMDVKRPDGKVERWEVELGPPNALLRRGWRKDLTPKGAIVDVHGMRAKDPKVMRMVGQRILLTDGRRLFDATPGDEEK